VTLAVSSTTVLSVNPSVPARTVKELVDVIRAGARKYSYATGGTGSQTHLAGEQFRLSLGLDLVHVPFGGGGPAVAAVVAGHAPIGFNALTPVVPQVKEGKLRALAVTSKTRSQILPEVPTMTEAGYPDIEGDSWVGILVPAETPKEIVGVLYREIAKIIALPEMKERLAALGFEPVVSAPDEFGRQIGAEIETWGRVIRAANIRTN
jgi:tripartite-type tricarboxylate transporter receptor subunit TctC